MKTGPSPQPKGSGSSQHAGASLTDAALAASVDLPGTGRDLNRPKGVLPRWDGDEGAGPMSLGSRRLYSDQGAPVEQLTPWQVIGDQSGSTPIACIEWNRVTVYREPVIDRVNRAPSLFRNANLTRGTFNGYMSPATRRKVRRIVATWIRSIMLYRAEVKRRYDPGRAYPVFVTLTLPSKQVHSDAVINRQCLQPFLVQLRRDCSIENYFWRAEAQENGNVHFHLLVDRFIDKRYLQFLWNNQVNRLGYVDRYFEETGSIFPPSTEVHRIRSEVRDKKTGEMRSVDPVDYLLDYVMDTPQPEPGDPGSEAEAQQPRKLIGRQRLASGQVITYVTRAIQGRVWGMSDTLREIREPRAEVNVALVHALEKARAQGVIRRVDTEHATLYFGKVSIALGRHHPGLWQLVKGHYLQVFGYLYPDQLPREHLQRHPPLDPRNLWIDPGTFSLYHRLKLDQPSPSFSTAAELEQWISTQGTTNRKASAA